MKMSTDINLRAIMRPGSLGLLSVQVSDGSFREIGRVYRRYSRGYRKHVRRMKQAGRR
jgi:hypothetical protein